MKDLEPEPQQQVPEEFYKKCRCALHLRVTGVVRPTVHQQHQCGWAALCFKLPCHFKRHICSKTITPKAESSCRLEFQKFGHVMSRHGFDSSKLVAPFHSDRFENVNRLVRAQSARQVGVAPKHSATRTMHQK